MKTTILKAASAIGLSALLVGSAAAQDSTVSDPVGYETLTIQNGFNYLGLRLHEPIAVSGSVASVTGTSVGVGDASLADLDDAITYLFEVTSGDASGLVIVVDSFDAVAGTVNLVDDISANLAEADSFSIRAQASLATVFGAQNSAGLDAGFGGTGGADRILIPNPDGGFDSYYYDNFVISTSSEGWANAVTLQPVDPTQVGLYYADGIVAIGDGQPNDFVVSGAVKLTPTDYSLVSGFNYLSTVAPVQGTLASIFGVENDAGLAAGFGGTGGADRILIPSSSGFLEYYYDNFVIATSAPGWADAQSLQPVDPSSISLDDASGFIVVNDGAAKNVTGGVPSVYADL